MRIVIVGAGAIGGWLGVRLAKAGQDVKIFARGSTLDAIRRDGLKLEADGRTVAARLSASDRAEDLGPQDLVIISVKGPAIAEVAPSVARMLGPETTMLPAINGIPWWFGLGLGGPLDGVKLRSIDPEGHIAAAIPPARVIGCVVHVSAAIAAPGHIRHSGGKRLIIGEPEGRATPRLTRVRDALTSAKLDIEVSDRIHTDLWFKLWGNMTMNPISALTRATTDRILDDELVRGFALGVMAEASELGRRIGCPIAESGEDRMKVTRKLGPIKTSMLQDVEAGRALEIDALLAGPREIAKQVGLATPNMDALHGLVRLYADNRR